MAITIIGYRGTGKTTVGVALAQRLGWDHVDTDPEVERTAGKTIAEIFASNGEPHFRTLESSELGRQLARGKIVISAGGGAILSEANRKMMQEAGPVIWLTAHVDTIAARILADPTTQDRRPALTKTDPISEIREVLERRMPLYREAASMIIETESRSPELIVEEILSKLPRASAP